MYRFTDDSGVVATLASPTWVKMQSNGSYALCAEPDAQGVAIDGTVYHIDGTPELDGVSTVILTEISEVAYQLEQQAALDARQLQTETALAEISIMLASSMTSSTE